MTTVSVVLTLRLPDAHSLKDKRSVVRSLVARLRQVLNLTASEVRLPDHHRQAQVGYAVVSESPSVARGLAEAALHFAERELIGRAEIVLIARDEQVLNG